MHIEKDKMGVYNIFFDSYKECEEDIDLCGAIITWKKFSIFIEHIIDDIEDYECVATTFCNNILIDRRFEKSIGNLLSNNQISYHYFDTGGASDIVENN